MVPRQSDEGVAYTDDATTNYGDYDDASEKTLEEKKFKFTSVSQERSRNVTQVREHDSLPYQGAKP